MDNEDFIDLSATSSSGGGSNNNELSNNNFEPSIMDSQPNRYTVKEEAFNTENSAPGEGEIRNLDWQHTQGAHLEKDMVDKPLNFQGSVELIEAVSADEKMNGTDAGIHGEKDCLTAQKESTCNQSPISGVKRARPTYDDQQPLVHVIYNSLSRKSKRKLEELLHHWSEWNAQQRSSSEDSDELLESGEETYYPAIHVGSDKSCTVSFLMDNQVRKKQSKDFIYLDSNSVTLYDRGYALGLTPVAGLTNQERGLETLDTSRCFNCGSYNHSLKDCPRPRNNVAVNNARKQHKAKKNHAAGPRNPTRYYQNSPGGKYDGLKAGVLSAETRQLLGLGELDPPPWLHRMREMGYPPGYLDPEDEDQPSGITIYADEETKGEQDGEIFKSGVKKPGKKMSVDFPGINAPIPVNADERRWAASLGPQSFDYSGSRSNYRSNYPSEGIAREQFYDQRWPRDYRNGGSPGHNLGVSPPMPCSHNYFNIDPNYTSDSLSPRGDIPMLRSPSLGRSLSDRSWKCPLVHEGSPLHSPHSFLPHSYPNPMQPPYT